MLTLEELEAAEAAQREELDALSDGERLAYFEKAEKAFKDPDTYATLAYIFISGLHHFYLKRWRRGLLDLGLNAVGVALVIAGVGYESWALGLAGVALWVGVSVMELGFLFRCQRVVREYNLQRQREILDELRWKQ